MEHNADTIDEKAVCKLIKKGAKAKSDEIIEAIKGYNIETDQAKKLELTRGHLEYLDDMITQTEVELYVRIKPYYEFVEFVSTMPGMTELSSTIVLAETGVNMGIFDDAKQLCSWCGLSPANNESAGKKKSVRIAKAGDYLKPMMVQCALAAIKSKKQPYRKLEEELKKRFQIREAVCVSVENSENPVKTVGAAAAKYVARKLSTVKYVAMTAGTTTRQIAESFSSGVPFDHVTFVPMSGGLGEERWEIQANVVCERME